tara:strand:- start:486 stop:1187 length:702 start_codon:yes stop_codon:yes gene_type:complete
MLTKKNNKEFKHFDKLSKEWWDENGDFKVLHQIRPIRIKYILNQLDSNIKNIDVLDLGCGGGLVSEPLARLGANVTGIDFVENNIKVAKLHSKKKNLNIKYISKDIENLDIKKKFDLIIMFEILEHLDDWEKFLKKIKINLKKNGKIIISTINRNIISKYIAIYFAENILRWIPKGTHNYNKFIQPDEIRDCMIKNNLSFQNIEGLIFDPINLDWRLSKNTNINYFCTFINSN